MEGDLRDKLLVRELVERWAAWRDAGDWERFAPLGVIAGVKLAHRIRPVLFYRLIYVGMFLTGVKLARDAPMR